MSGDIIPSQEEAYNLVASHPNSTTVELTDLLNFNTTWERLSYKSSLARKLKILEKWNRIERIPRSNPAIWRLPKEN